MAATTANSTREVEAVKKQVESGSFGLVLGVSGLKTTGASKVKASCPELYCLFHY
jgi:hypothetical protein